MRPKSLALGLILGLLVVIWWHQASAQGVSASITTAASCYPQGPIACTKVSVNQGTTPFPPTSICYAVTNVAAANSARARLITSIASITQANPAVITVTAGHGFPPSTLPVVTISGVTGTGWPPINNTWVATVINTTTFSVPFNSGGLGAPPTATGTYTSTAPRTNVPEWAVQIFTYDTNHAQIGAFWQGNLTLGTNSPGGPTAGFNNKCSDVGGTTIPVQ